MFIAALYTIAKTQKLPSCPLTDECIKKMWYIYTMDCPNPGIKPGSPALQVDSLLSESPGKPLYNEILLSY